MDSTNNEIYKIAKYLDKYTKEGNKEGGVYLQKLDNYLHKVQYGGNGIVQLAEQIGKIVDKVVEKHQKAKGELEQLLDGVKGQDLESKIQNKMEKLKVAKEGLERTIAQKEAEKEKLARETSPASSAPAPEAPEAVTFDTVTHEKLVKLTREEVYELVCQKAEIDPKIDGLKQAFTNSVGTANYNDDWTFKFLLNDLYTKEYFKHDNNIINLMKMIRVLLQLHAKVLIGTAPPEIEEIGFIIKHLTNNEKDIKIFNKYIKEIIFEKDDYTFTFDDFKKFKTSQPPSSASEPVLRTRVPTSPEKQAEKEQAQKLGAEAQEKRSALKSTIPKDPLNPTSKKFDIVGFTINKQGQHSTYVIPEQQKTKVLEVLPQELKDQLKSEDVQLLENKKARIEFKNFLSIKEILQQINERKPLQPTQFKTTDKEGNITEKPLNVWLFIVPMTYNLDQITQDNEYFDAINKIEEEELKKIAFKMEDIIKQLQPVAQSPGGRGGRGGRGGQARGGSMTSRGPYRHP